MIRRLLTAALILLVLCAFAAQILAWRDATQDDDAFISYRYARNLASGHGLVYNLGERVEGYTDFLWTVLLAGVVAVGGDPVTLAPWIGAIAALALILLLLRQRPAGLAAAAFFAAGGAVAVQAVQGLETALFALFVTGALLLDAREREAGRDLRHGRSGWLYALAALTRPEGLAVLAVAAAVRAASSRRRPGATPAIHPRAEAAWLARALVPAAAHVAFRLAYYGDVVPNTFHAKVAFSVAVVARGLGQVGEFAGAYLPVLLLAAVGLVVERRRERAKLIAAWTLFQLVYVAYVGGDFKPTFRFFASVIPALCLMAGVGLSVLLRPSAAARPLRALVLRTGVAAVAVAWLWYGSVGARGWAHWRRSVLPMHQAAGRWLAAHYPPTTVLATNNAGCLPYYSNFPTIDMMGLCDPVIARRVMPPGGPKMAGHEKGDGAYVLSRAPDLILFTLARFSTGEELREEQVARKLFGVSERELWMSQEFHRLYHWKSAALPGFNFSYYERITPQAQ